ncbi:MAG: TIGR03905 family TSCPD domain-containing protein [Flexilinea sp.]
MHYSYKTKGTCSRLIEFDVIENTVHNVKFISGCEGNLVGIGILVEGMAVNDVISKLEGISCEGKPTSCPDQLTRALKSVRAA